MTPAGEKRKTADPEYLSRSTIQRSIFRYQSPNDPNCPRRCDCSHPSECLFATSEPQRASFAVVWIVGAAVLAAVILIVLLL
jgi:hypothetical protein